MRIKFLAMIAAVALVAACETAPEGAGNVGGTGGDGTGGVGAGTMAQAPGSEQDFLVNVGDRVFFDLDKYDIRDDARAALEKQGAWLGKYPAVTVSIEGHCDERGTREYNLALGERRANAVKDYLVALGVNPNRIKTISYGKEQPVALGHDEGAWAQNRRGVTVLTSGTPQS